MENKKINPEIDSNFQDPEGIDPTADEVTGSDIVSPFDPKKIKITVEQKTIDNLVQRLKFNEIDLNTEFQRKGNLWKPDQQSKLIESILLRFPLPAFFFDAENDEKWLVVDGLQRLWTFKNYIAEQEFGLTGLEILTEFSEKGIVFDKLNRTMQRRILETQVTTYIIQPGTPKEVKYNVFRRINTGGLVLNPMEIRNALNQGTASNFLRDVSEDDKFRKLVYVRNKRMEDRELILRSIAFILIPYDQYAKPLSSFLDRAMELLGSQNEKGLKTLKETFFKAIDLAHQLFEDHLFSRSITGETNYRLNSALFEVWVSELAKLNQKETAALMQNKQKLVTHYIELLNDDDFYKAIVSSTSGKGAVDQRFTSITTLISHYTYND
ncbi:MAG TPA: DUF262 domain-containing protein [Cyclobacteriaceae bacterium]|nr:DUF262 domain-containing protein [Cyclobacteriaceae bacterium]